jgi:hypothetical protein
VKYVERRFKHPDLWIREVKNTGKPGLVRLDLQLSNQGKVAHSTINASVELSLWQVAQLVKQTRDIVDRQIAGLQAERAQLG